MIVEPKLKYRVGGSAKSVQGKTSGNGTKKRPGHHKLSEAQKKHLKQRKRVMVMDAQTGKCRMVDA